MSTAKEARVVRESIEDTSRRLHTLIARMEHRYECSSVEMETAVASGGTRETAEIARWMAAHHFLLDLAARGSTIGTPTKSSR